MYKSVGIPSPLLPMDSHNAQQQVPQAATGAITYLGNGTSIGPPATTSVGPCDSPWYDQQKTRIALPNFPNFKPNQIEISQHKTWYSPLTASSEESVCRTPALVQGCHNPYTLLGTPISYICHTLTLCLPLTFKFRTSPSSPLLAGVAITSPGILQRKADDPSVLVLITLTEALHLSTHHCSCCSRRSTTAWARLSDAGSAQWARLWTRANQGWRPAVSTFGLREQVYYSQHFHPRNCKPIHTPNPFLFARGVIPVQTNTPLMETAGLWVHGSKHHFVFWVLLSHLNYLKFSGQTSTPLPAFAPILLWAESPQVLPLLFSLSLYSPTHLLLFFPCLRNTFALSPSSQFPGARELISPSVVTDTSVKGSAIHSYTPKQKVQPHIARGIPSPCPRIRESSFPFQNHGPRGTF